MTGQLNKKCKFADWIKPLLLAKQDTMSGNGQQSIFSVNKLVGSMVPWKPSSAEHYLTL